MMSEITDKLGLRPEGMNIALIAPLVAHIRSILKQAENYEVDFDDPQYLKEVLEHLEESLNYIFNLKVRYKVVSLEFETDDPDDFWVEYTDREGETFADPIELQIKVINKPPPVDWHKQSGYESLTSVV